MMSDKICNDSVCEVNDILNNINMSSTEDDSNNVSVCANCGKEGSDINNICNKCKQVKYCNASCKKKHRHKHKKQCEEHQKLAAEHAAELHNEKLFKQPPPNDDCPICFIRMPALETGGTYYACCGKLICSGCCNAPVYDNQGNIVEKKCSFCRTLLPTTDEELINRYKKRLKAGDPIAIFNLGSYYRYGIYNMPLDYIKALELWHRAAELGHAEAYVSIGYAYHNGSGVEIDEKKALYYCELGAIAGNVKARYNLGASEENLGDFDRALKHHMIAVAGGYSKSLKQIKMLYSSGHATKEDYMRALQSFQAYLGEIKSVQRDKAAAADDQCRYY